MNPDALTDALRRLEAAGWPLEHFKDFDCTYAYKLMSPNDPDMWYGFGFWDDELPEWFGQAVLMGWLKNCLEARGYRREVRWIYGDDCAVQICDGETGAPLRWDGNAKTELEALLEACEAVANG